MQLEFDIPVTTLWKGKTVEHPSKAEKAFEMDSRFAGDFGEFYISQINYSEGDGFSITVKNHSELFPETWEIYPVIQYDGPNARIELNYQELPQ